MPEEGARLRLSLAGDPGQVMSFLRAPASSLAKLSVPCVHLRRSEKKEGPLGDPLPLTSNHISDSWEVASLYSAKSQTVAKAV